MTLATGLLAIAVGVAINWPQSQAQETQPAAPSQDAEPAPAEQPDAEARPANRRPDPSRLFERFDANKDGGIDRDEAPPQLKRQFDQFDNDQDGKVSLEELRQNMPAARFQGQGPGRRPGEVIAPAARQERIGETLAVGDPAPDFTLPLADGQGELTLSELHRHKPVVLVFGSLSCSPFRYEVEQVEKLYQQHREQAHFVMVYIREAHPDSEIFIRDESGSEQLRKIVQTDDVGLRTEYAQVCSGTLKLSFPVLVDGADNQVNKAYSGWPIRLVIVDTQGKIADPGRPGPRGFDPAKVAEWLRAHGSRAAE